MSESEVQFNEFFEDILKTTLVGSMPEPTIRMIRQVSFESWRKCEKWTFENCGGFKPIPIPPAPVVTLKSGKIGVLREEVKGLKVKLRLVEEILGDSKKENAHEANTKAYSIVVSK